MNDDQFLKDMDSAFDLIHAKMDLIGQRCGLYHIPGEELPEAVNYIIQEFGMEGAPVTKVRIPVCQECIEGLLSGEWILLYCLQCNQSRWALRDRIKTQYINKNKPINWMKYCPHCHKEK